MEPETNPSYIENVRRVYEPHIYRNMVRCAIIFQIKCDMTVGRFNEDLPEFSEEVQDNFLNLNRHIIDLVMEAFMNCMEENEGYIDFENDWIREVLYKFTFNPTNDTTTFFLCLPPA